MKNWIILLALWLGTSGAWAQSFAPRMLDFSRKKPSYLVLKDGTEITGFYKGAKRKKGLLKQITFEDTVTLEKAVYLAEDIQSMRLVPSGWGEFVAISESTESLTKMKNTDMKQLKRDFIYFESAQLPDKKKTNVLLQLINPGFDSRIKVFDDPLARETMGVGVAGMTVTGGNFKSYYLIRDGQAFKVLKNTYKKDFLKIYGNCSALKGEYDSVKWLDFAEHVAFHEVSCE